MLEPGWLLGALQASHSSCPSRQAGDGHLAAAPVEAAQCPRTRAGARPGGQSGRALEGDSRCFSTGQAHIGSRKAVPQCGRSTAGPACSCSGDTQSQLGVREGEAVSSGLLSLAPILRVLSHPVLVPPVHLSPGETAASCFLCETQKGPPPSLWNGSIRLLVGSLCEVRGRP